MTGLNQRPAGTGAATDRSGRREVILDAQLPAERRARRAVRVALGRAGCRAESVMIMEEVERLLTPGEVALLFRVDPKTVTRWAAAGSIGSIRTPGGHRRFRESEVLQLLATRTTDAARSTS